MRNSTVVFITFIKISLCSGLNSILTDNYTDSLNNTLFDYGFEEQNIGRMLNNCADISGPCFQRDYHPQDSDAAPQTSFIYLRVIEFLYNFQEKYLYVFSAIGIFGNLLICIAIMRNTKLQNSPNSYIFNLAATDILSLTFSCFLQSFKVSGWMLNIVTILSWSCDAVNICTTVGITLDRYIAVCFPFKSRTICTQSRALKINISIWLCSLFHSTIMLKHNSKEVPPGILRDCFQIIFSEDMMAIFFFLFPLIIIIGVYSSIALSIFKSAKLRRKSYAMEHTTKGLNLSVSVVLQFLISWGIFYAYVFAVNHYPLQIGFAGGLMCLYISKIINLLFKIIDPFIYSCVSRQFRQAFKEIVCPSCVTNESIQNSAQGP